MSPQEALEKVEAAFPFENYIQGDRSNWLTVGSTVDRYLDKGSKVFDFGSGACDKTAIASVYGCECDAVDDLNDDWYLRGDNVKKIEVFAKSMGIGFSREFKGLKADTYDMVMMNDVLEHIHDSPRELLNSLVGGLREGGLLFVTVPNLANIRKRIDLMRGRTNLANYDLYYWYEGPWRGPQREYVKGDLVSMSSNLGLEIVELRTVHHMLDNLPKAAKPIYKAVTSVFTGWRDTWLLVAKKPAGWSPKLKITNEEYADIYGGSSNRHLYD